MRYEVEFNGRVRQIEVGRAGTTLTVRVDGRERRVDAVRIGDRALSLLVDDASYDVAIAPAPGGLLDVRVGDVAVTVAVDGMRRRERRHPDGAHAGAGPQRVVAPMPGKVVRVAVKPGDAVRARQTLVVVEAMKMENELRALRDGIVGELHAREGLSVEAGALLVVIQ